MAIDFPDNPSVNDTFTAGGKVYQWDGTVWEIYGPNVSPGTFKIDDINNRVGINNASPITDLDVDGDIKVYNANIGGTASASGDISADTFTSTGTGANIMPSGTTAERPVTPTAGMFRFNETTGEPEWYSSAVGLWIPFRSAPELAIEYLVVAGGGGAGGSSGTSIASGGGGAGGYRSSVIGESSGGGNGAEATLSLSVDTAYNVTIGAGGNGGGPGFATGSKGQDTSFHTVTSLGGGGGGTWSNAATSGGSGGAAGENGQSLNGAAGTTNQGYAGGNDSGYDNGSPSSGGGGGGAGGVGGNTANTSTGGSGGPGVVSWITNSAVTYAAGGGGAANGTAGTSATGGNGRQGTTGRGSNGNNNTGGGGGGSLTNGTEAAQQGGNGGSGVVILRYPNGLSITLSAGLTGSTSTIGQYKVTEITAGTGTVSWS